MSDFEKLKSISPQQIHQKCYISPKIIKLLINKEFDKIGSKSKVLGFIKILERELSLELDDLKREVEEYFDSKSSFEHKENTQNKREDGSLSIVKYVAIAVLVLALILFYIFSTKPKEKKETKPFSSSSSFSQSTFSSESNVTFVSDTNDSNVSKDSNTTDENLSTEQSVVFPTITIIPKKKLWVGIIYLDNYKKRVYITKDPIEINTSRDQLITMAHSLFQIEEDGNIKEYNEKGRLYFIYRAGILEKIDKKIFKEYNKGKSW